MKNTLYIILIIILTSCQSANESDTVLQPNKSFLLKVKEPSGLSYRPQSNTLYIVSDHGYIVETDLQGKIIRKSDKNWKDLEGIAFHNNQLVVVDEKNRVFYTLNQSFKIIKKQRISYKGSKNKGFESLTYNPTKKCFITLSEKVPAILIELDNELKIIQKKKLHIDAKDISAACYFKGFIWLLSDESQAIYQCNADTYQVIHSYKIPIKKPEGITFDKQGNMYICSDSKEQLYVFSGVY